MKKFFGIVIFGIAAALTAKATVHDISIAGFAFSPTSVTITQGDSVRWTNLDAVNHTSTADTGQSDFWDSGLLGTNQSYLRQYNIVGSFGYHCTPHPFMTGTVIVEQITEVKSGEDHNLPREFNLLQNYPNPFNASTTISYLLPVTGEVSLTVYNLLGQTVRTLIQGRQSAGSYSIVWDGKNQNGSSVSSGIYFYRLRTENLSQVRKMVFLK